MNRRILLGTLAILLILHNTAGFAQAERYLSGTHYKTLDVPVRTADETTIEVLEIFWYGCPGCYTFEPILNNWADNRADDIDLVRFPGIFNPLMKVHAQIYYMSAALGVLDLTHDKVFDALVSKRKTLSSQQQIVDQFVEFGEDKLELEKAFNSFAVRTKTNQAEKLTRDYQPGSTPSMVVNGKYLVSLDGPVRSYQDMLRVVDFLTEKERNSLSRVPPHE